jgi:hypothetical protein
MKKPKGDDFLQVLELAVREALKDGTIDAKDRLKAIEIGSKLAAIRNKIDDSDKGNFFK